MAVAVSRIRVSTRIEIVASDGEHLIDVTLVDTVDPGEDRTGFATATGGACESVSQRARDMLATLFSDGSNL